MRARKTLRQKRNIEQVSKSLPSKSRETTLRDEQTEKKRVKPEWTIERLTTNYVPNYLIGRDAEKQRINDFVEDCMMNRINSKVLYISGVPGVGKTASTLQIIKKLKEQYSSKVQFGFINAMTFNKPEKVYRPILDILEVTYKIGMKLTLQIQEALKHLKKSYLIVIDQVDFLLTKNQQIFYNLFEWAYHGTSKLGFIVIANTMDFPEKLSQKINSRMGNHRLVFKPYTYEQIRQIIDERLDNCNFFAPSALTFLSKKLSTYSSDMRTIFEQSFVESKQRKNNNRVNSKAVGRKNEEYGQQTGQPSNSSHSNNRFSQEKQQVQQFYRSTLAAQSERSDSGSIVSSPDRTSVAGSSNLKRVPQRHVPLSLDKTDRQYLR